MSGTKPLGPVNAASGCEAGRFCVDVQAAADERTASERQDAVAHLPALFNRAD